MILVGTFGTIFTRKCMHKCLHTQTFLKKIHPRGMVSKYYTSRVLYIDLTIID